MHTCTKRSESEAESNKLKPWLKIEPWTYFLSWKALQILVKYTSTLSRWKCCILLAEETARDDRSYGRSGLGVEYKSMHLSNSVIIFGSMWSHFFIKVMEGPRPRPTTYVLAPLQFKASMHAVLSICRCSGLPFCFSVPVPIYPNIRFGALTLLRLGSVAIRERDRKGGGRAWRAGLIDVWQFANLQALMVSS